MYVYVRISCVVAQRHDQLASIDRQARVSQHMPPHYLLLRLHRVAFQKSQKLVKEESDMDRGSSECEEHNMRCAR